MPSEPLVAPKPGEFRQRGREVGRVEAFSDAVFGLAVAFLMVNLDPPTTFSDLMLTMRASFVFLVCFAAIVLIWYEHHVFFRRYGMHDPLTVVLNAALLFVVLLYIYPLRFLFTLLVGSSAGRPDAMRAADGPTLMALYGAGFLVISLLLAAMFAHARRQRAQLGLNALELHDTDASLTGNLVNGAVAAASVAIALVGGPAWSAVAGFAYFAIGPLRFAHGWWYGARRERLVARG